MQYIIRKFHDPITNNQDLYYAFPHITGTINVREIANRIADGSTLTAIDVIAVLEAFLLRVPDYLVKGYSVKLGDFGSFRLSFKAKGQIDKDKVSASDIKSMKVLFHSGSELKKILVSNKNFELAEIEKVSQNKNPGSGTESGNDSSKEEDDDINF